MRVHSVVAWIAVVGTLASWAPRAALGQEFTLAPRTPRFFYASSTAAKPVEIDVSHSAVLSRVVSLHLARATIGGLLAEIQRQTGLTFAYDPRFPATRPITLEAESITIAAALGAILVGTGVDVVLTRTGHVWLTESKPGTPRVQEGTIVGRITDKQTGGPLVGATVTLEPARQSAITDSDGQFRFANLTPGSYTVRARYIGYRALMASATVGADQEVVVDFQLEKSAQQLDEVVTTGTVVPTEVKALPSPVTVVTALDIKEQRPRTMNQVFRQAVPSGVAWVQSNFPQVTAMSARGASSFSPGGNAMKVFVDGVQLKGTAVAPVDPTSIERVEVVRGPQAATLYGSEAIGGVVQIFTKRGDSLANRPQIDVSAALGALQTPYDGYGGTLRQQYAGSVRGAAHGVSYNVGGGYTRVGDWMPEGAQSLPSVYGGIQIQQHSLTLDISGRYYQQSLNQTASPLLANTGYPLFSRPFYQEFRIREQTLGARLSWSTTSWLQQNLTVGVDRYLISANQTQPRLTTPEDTLLFVDDQNDGRATLAYNASVSGPLVRDVTGTFTAGVDHYDLRTSLYFTSGALDTIGTIRTAPGQAIFGNRNHVTNTGYFAQAQVSYRSALFLTAGLRAENNSTFGNDLGTPVSPRVGISYATAVGSTTVKVRGSYGEAIRPPNPLASQALPTSPAISQVANPNLGPERQHGWDAGFDLRFGGRASLGVTYYSQIAEDLIQPVVLSAGPPLVRQNQNVGRVRNKGIEIEGSLEMGPARLKGQFAVNTSRIDGLAPNYTGDLRVGERPFQVPRYTAGASLTLFPLAGTTLTGGLTYVSDFTYYDFYAQYACFGHTAPCRASNRDYLTTYPGFAKLDASVTQRLTPWASGFVTVENVGNRTATEDSNLVPVMGRLTMIGLELHY